MSEEEKSRGFLMKIVQYAFRSPVSVICLGALAWFLMKIYLLGQDTLLNMAYLVGIVALWGVWFLARSFFKVILLLLVIGGLLVGYYYFSHYDELTCKNDGGHWNKELKVCEEKLTLWRQVQEWWQDKAKN